MLIIATFTLLAWLVMSKAVYDNIRERDRASPSWRIAGFALLGPPIILYGIACRLLGRT